MGSLVEDCLRKNRRSLRSRSVHRPEGDVELRWNRGSEEAGIVCEAAVEFKRSPSARFEPPRELPARRVRQELLGSPECYGSGSGTRLRIGGSDRR